MNKICIGCGISLQTTNKDEKGYTPTLTNDYCMRCFRLKNYGEKKGEDIIKNNDILTKINHQKGFVFFLIDFLSINKENLSFFKNITLKKALIISKSDILRQDMKPSKLKLWLKNTYNITEDIFFLSTKTNYFEINLFKYLENNNYNTCLITGLTNAGKSTFLNNLLKESNQKKEIVVSKYPNTTLDFIKFKINNTYIYDTPGFIPKYPSPLEETKLKPISLNITKPLTITIAKNYKISFNKPNKIILYLKNNLYTKEYVTYPASLLSIPPNSDLILPGLGFINIKERAPISTNIKDIEIRPNYSGGPHE